MYNSDFFRCFKTLKPDLKVGAKWENNVAIKEV